MIHQELIQSSGTSTLVSDPSPNARHVYMETFGCQMNEYDTELVRSLLKQQGFAFTDHSDQADVVLLNTCAIRENAHNRVYGHLGQSQEPQEGTRARHWRLGVYGAKPEARIAGDPTLY